jgi:Ca2+-binding RTX toxin-like protein
VEGEHAQAWGGRGNDSISAIATFDPVKLYGEAGDDSLIGGFNSDFLNGGDGNDELNGFGGTDYLRGGNGDDTLTYLDIRDALPIPGEASTYSGGAGHDTLELFVQPLIQGYVEIRITGESKGVMGYSDGLDSTIFDKVVNFTGMNEFVVLETGDGSAPLIYRGGDSDSTVRGSQEADILIGGEGDETFAGGEMDDRFIFDFRPANLAKPGELSMGHDRILDFSRGGDLGIDTIEIADGAGQITTTQTEKEGVTTFTSFDLNGNAIHVLDVVGVGLPPIGFTEIA